MTVDNSDRELSITRVFDAPRERVWRAWSDPLHLMQWWGPNGFTNTFEHFDFRPGGTWRFVMHGPDGTDYPNENMFAEIVALQRIVIDHVSRPKFRAIATFEDVPGGKTRVSFRQVFETADLRDQIKHIAEPGNEQFFAKLGAYLATMDEPTREITISRRFAAPRALVWRAWTDPVELAAWWGPAGFTNPVCEIDPRPGGAMHIVMRAPDGAEYPMRGTFREVVPPQRLVFTNNAIDAAGNALIDGLTTVTFAERDGATELTLQTRASALVPLALRMIVGMEAGWRQSLDRLAGRFRGDA